MKKVLVSFLFLAFTFVSHTSYANDSCVSGKNFGANPQTSNSDSRVSRETDSYTVYENIDRSSGAIVSREVKAKSGYQSVFHPGSKEKNPSFDIFSVNGLKKGTVSCDGCCNGFCGDCANGPHNCAESAICPDGSSPPCKATN